MRSEVIKQGSHNEFRYAERMSEERRLGEGKLNSERCLLPRSSHTRDNLRNIKVPKHLTLVCRFSFYSSIP